MKTSKLPATEDLRHRHAGQVIHIANEYPARGDILEVRHGDASHAIVHTGRQRELWQRVSGADLGDGLDGGQLKGSLESVVDEEPAAINSHGWTCFVKVDIRLVGD